VPTVFGIVGARRPPEAHRQRRPLYAILQAPRRRRLVTEAFSIRGEKCFAFVEEVGQLQKR
jgi:hypothetical protein